MTLIKALDKDGVMAKIKQPIPREYLQRVDEYPNSSKEWAWGFNKCVSENDKLALLIESKEMYKVIEKKYMGTPKEIRELIEDIKSTVASWAKIGVIK